MLTNNIQPLLNILHTHPHWAVFIIFFLSFLESAAVIGLLFPGTIIMTAVGALVGTGTLSFLSVALWAATGAIVGDVLSFWLGHHYHEHIRDFWPFRKYPHLLEKGEKFFRSHGGKSVLIGRFAGPMRPLLPLVAGMMSMSWRRFLIADIFSGILWAPLYMLPGILLGLASQELPPEMATQLLLAAMVVVIVLWCISWLLRRLYASIHNVANRGLARLWYFIRTRPLLQRIEQVLMDPTHPDNHHQLGLAILALLTFPAFFILLHSMATHGVLTAWNEPLYYFMRSLRTTFFDRLMLAITTINPIVQTTMWGAIWAWLLLRRYWWAAWHWLVLGILVIGAGKAVKLLLHSPRPPGLLQTPAGWSFPSGHVLLSITFFGFLALILTHNRSRRVRWVAYSGVILLALSILFSRLYLGAHWLTDVVGSALLGLGLLAVVTISYRRRAVPFIASTGVLVVALVSLVGSWSWYWSHHHRQELHYYTPTWPTQTLDSKKWWRQNNNHQPPLYRTNRFGKTIEIINVQWAGAIPSIAENLQQRGWKILPKTSLLIMLNELANKHSNQRLPLLSQFYEDRKPVLVMYKMIPAPKAIVVLRLWDAHLTLSNDQPLWLGTVTYHHPWHLRLKHRSEKKAGLPEPTTLLSTDLMGYDWKKITYPPAVLLIRPSP